MTRKCTVIAWDGETRVLSRGYNGHPVGEKREVDAQLRQKPVKIKVLKPIMLDSQES